jgi:glycosyltransferase involved in cell wall biosynthesis
MNVAFCRWLAKRKLANPDEQIDLMIHEPCLGLWEGGLRHNIVALVHRAMLIYLLKSADRVWISIPAWEPILRPLLFGREIPIECAPVPSNIPVSISGADADYAIGYFGHYDKAGIRVVMQLLDALPDRIALIGRGAERIPMHERTIVIGETDAERLSRAIASCWVMCHHYIDGVNGRRGTAMASLSHGKAVVTVEGELTEPFWRESNAVALCAVGDVPAMAAKIRALLRDHEERGRMGKAAVAFYRERFSIDRTIAKLLR